MSTSASSGYAGGPCGSSLPFVLGPGWWVCCHVWCDEHRRQWPQCGLSQLDSSWSPQILIVGISDLNSSRLQGVMCFICQSAAFPGEDQTFRPLTTSQESGDIAGFIRKRPEKGLATHSSVLAWNITWTGEPGGLQPPMGLQTVRHDWATNTQTHTSGSTLAGVLWMTLRSGRWVEGTHLFSFPCSWDQGPAASTS